MKPFIVASAFLFVSLCSVQAQRIVRVAGGEIDGLPALESDVSPYRFATAPDGTIYFLSLGDWTIRKIDPVTGIVSRFAGNGDFGQPVNGTNALNTPLPSLEALEIGPDGLVYLAGGSSVIKFDLNAEVVIVAGLGYGYEGDGGPATAAKFESITDVAFDSHGNLFVADRYRIRKINGVSGIVTTYAGTGSLGSDGDNGPATAAKMYALHLTFDGQDNLYVSDILSKALRKIDPTTDIITRFAGNGTDGFSGDGGPAVDAQFRDSPRSVAIKGDEMFIADIGNFKIRKVIISTGIISTMAGTTLGFSGDGGPAISAQLATVQDMGFDIHGNLIFYDNGRLRKISSSTISTAAGFGYASPDGRTGLLTPLNAPMGIVTSLNGDLIFADAGSSRIRKIDHATGIVSTIAGTGEEGFSGDDGPAINAKLKGPFGVLIDGEGNIIFSDRWNNRVRKIDMATGNISTIAGNGSWEDTGDGGPATTAGVPSPMGIAIDHQGNLIVVAESVHKIKKIDNMTGIITTIAGNGGFGEGGDGGPAINAQMLTPYAVAAAPDGSLYVADYSSQSIRKIDPNGIISLFAGKGQGIVTSSSSAKISILHPFALTFAPGGDLFVGSYGMVSRLDMATNILYPVSGSVYPQGITGDGGDAINAKLAYPYGLAFDQLGNLFISDGGRNVVRKIAFSEVVGVELNEIKGGSILAYPNPVKDQLIVEVNGIPGAVSDLRVMDIQGKVMAIEAVPQGAVSIDVREYPPGIYILMIGKPRFIGKFIKTD